MGSTYEVFFEDSVTIFDKRLMLMISVVVAVMTFLTTSTTRTIRAVDNGQWELTDPAIREWFQELKMPDNPHVSCCGFADAYYADKVYTKNGKNIAVITDTRPDAPLQRPHIPPGTEFVIPDHKMKWDKGNPTGHNVIFLSNANGQGQRDVYCFVDGGGV
jgi:hypothetical protein